MRRDRGRRLARTSAFAAYRASGLGRHIAEAVLASGDRLLGTARDPRQLADLVKRYRERIRTAPLDVTDAGRGT